MKRRSILSLVGLAPLTLISSKIPRDNSIVDNLIKRWKKSKEYTLAVLEAMPADNLEYSPTRRTIDFCPAFSSYGLY